MNAEEQKILKEISGFLKENGYNTGNSEGIIGADPIETCIGILGHRKKLINTKRIKIDSPIRAEYFANLYLNTDQDLDKVEKKWAIIIHGEKNMYRFDKIIEHLEKKYGVSIQKYMDPTSQKEYDAFI